MPQGLSITISPLIGSPDQGDTSDNIPRSRYARFCCSMHSDLYQKTLLTGMIRQPPTAIHDLNDDSLLNIFYICRPSVFEENEYGDIWLGDLVGECWWYRLVQVCRRWRYLILRSASYLRLALVCTRGTPVADMLMHSPPLPLVIDHDDINMELAGEDEEGMMLALQNRNRVRRINLRMPILSLQKLFMVIDGEFPILEFLIIDTLAKQNAPLSLPPSFEAPQLRHLWLDYFASPIGSPFLTSAVGLVTLYLRWIHTSTFIQPELFLRAFSLLPLLERLEIGFISAVPNSEIESQLLRSPTTIQIIIPNLRQFMFWGNSGYLETLLPHMITPLLEMLITYFFNQLSFSVPRLLQFMITTEYPQFSRARFLFYHEGVYMKLDNPLAGPGPPRLTSFRANITCRHLDWQVSSLAQILNDLRPLFSSVANLILDYREHTLSSEIHNEVDPMLWLAFLESFRNVEILRVHKGLVGEVSNSLRLHGQPPLELLPELKELVCPTRSVENKSFSPFIHDREVAGRPLKLIGEAFPVGRENYYIFYTSTGLIDVTLDQDPLP
jgi:hypothetical protein